MHMLIAAIKFGIAARTVLAIGIGIGAAYLTEETEDIAPPQRHIGAQEGTYLMLMLQIIQVLQADVEVLAQVQVEVAQIEIVTQIIVTRSDGQIVGHEIAEIGAGREGMALNIHILQHQQVDVVGIPFLVIDGTAHHPLALGNEYRFQGIAVNPLKMTPAHLLPLHIAVIHSRHTGFGHHGALVARHLVDLGSARSTRLTEGTTNTFLHGTGYLCISQLAPMSAVHLNLNFQVHAYRSSGTRLRQTLGAGIKRIILLRHCQTRENDQT